MNLLMVPQYYSSPLQFAALVMGGGGGGFLLLPGLLSFVILCVVSLSYAEASLVSPQPFFRKNCIKMHRFVISVEKVSSWSSYITINPDDFQSYLLLVLFFLA